MNQPFNNNNQGGLFGIISPFLSIIGVLFLCLGVVGFLYYFILGIVAASDVFSGAFRIFVSYFANALECAFRYVFYFVVTLGVNKLAKK